ncbi:MAG: hypothetical protein IPP07_28410 [Holophagales bacterium]|nr:hypothetical protein [Holophagales bacterium]
MLLSRTNATVLSDTDYLLRKTDTECSIEAVVSLAESVGIRNEARTVWPWEWDEKNAVLPDLENAPGAGVDAVNRFRVRGTQEFELI